MPVCWCPGSRLACAVAAYSQCAENQALLGQMWQVSPRAFVRFVLGHSKWRRRAENAEPLCLHCTLTGKWMFSVSKKGQTAERVCSWVKYSVCSHTRNSPGFYILLALTQLLYMHFDALLFFQEPGRQRLFRWQVPILLTV